MQYLEEDSDETKDMLDPQTLSTTSLTPEEKEVFVDALSIGAKTKTVDVFGHKVTIKTTSVREDLQMALVIKPWEETKGYVKAFKLAAVAGAVTEINGEPLFVPVSPADEDSIVQRKFDKLLGYYSVFIDAVFDEVTQMSTDVEKSLVSKLGKSQG